MPKEVDPRPFCLCGCGERVGVYTRTVTAKGRKKGDYGRYKRGHWGTHTGIPHGLSSTDRSQYMKEWSRINNDLIAERRRVKYLALKAEIVAHYSGGTNACACCGEDGMPFLTIDHIIPSRSRRAGSNLYKDIRRDGFPEGFQVLCFNCNCAKRTYDDCPHKTRVPNS